MASSELACYLVANLEFNMKVSAIPCAIAALLLSMGGVASAQSKPSSDGPQAEPPSAKPDSAKVPLGQRGNSQDQRRQMDHPGSIEVESASSKGPDAGPTHDLYKGNKLPVEYHHKPQFVVDDWRSHHLSAPPRGQHWVKAGYVYVLVAIDTGMIVKIKAGK